MNMFEIAARKKIRFESNKGLLSVEDLWDLPLTTIDKIAINLFNSLKLDEPNSFVNVVEGPDPTIKQKFDIVKYIIDVRIAERNIATEASQRAEKKQAILAAIARKEDEVLLGSSIEDLRKMAENL